MSIQGALSSSLTALQVLGQQTSVISNNIGNANTAGYVQQDLPQSELLSGGSGAGVMAEPVQRLADQAAATMANQANGAQAFSQQMVDSLTQYTQVLGQPSSSSSLPAIVSAFNSALTTLSATPGDATAQSQAEGAASSVASTFNQLADAVATGREQADQGIASGVADVNSLLDQLSQNETRLQSAAGQQQPTVGFQDTRDKLLSSLSQELPIKVYQNGTNGIIVTTDGGTTLWDGKAHKLAFTPTPNIPTTLRVTADPANGFTGGLSQVTVGGNQIAISQNGKIAANLQLRDGTLPGFADQLDQAAGNLIRAFQSADPTVSSGQTGLFTDAGAAVASGSPTAGMASRIAINASVDPVAGGSAWRLQSGAQAASPGAANDATTVLAFAKALQTTQSYNTGSGLPSAMTLSDATSQIAGLQQSTLTTWTNLNTSRTQQAQDAQTALSNKTGVNVDEQMQRLLIVQQSYQASAEVIQVASSMMNDLLQATHP